MIAVFSHSLVIDILEQCMLGVLYNAQMQLDLETKSRLLALPLHRGRGPIAFMKEGETTPDFLHNQVIGTKMFGPMLHSKPPDVDFESVRSAANDASLTQMTAHLSKESPTQHCCP